MQLSRRTRAGYALGSVATGSFGTVPGLLLLPFLTDALDVTAALAGMIVLLPKVFDIILNPLAGRLSDRSVSPLGPRRPFLLRAGIALAACFAVLFAAPDVGSVAVESLWVLLAFVGCAAAYAFFQVPYFAMLAEMTDDYTERTRLMSWRIAVLTVTILVSGGAAPAIRDQIGGRGGYRLMGLTVALILAAGTVGAYYGTRSAPIGRETEATGSLREQLRIIAQVPDFRRLVLTMMFQSLAMGSMLAGVDYVARYVIGSSGAATIAFVCIVGPALLVSPLWLALGNRFGKKVAYLLASAILATEAVTLTTADVLPTWCVYLAMGVVGAGFTGAQVFPLAMLPDIVAVDSAKSGIRRAGVYTGIWTAGETVGLALGPGIYGLVLAAGGYNSSTTGSTAQPHSAVTAIILGVSAVPALFILASFIPLARYRLTAQEVQVSV